MATQISDPSVLVNNNAVFITPNSLAFTEGFGEQEILVQSAGGGVLDQVFADDIESNYGMVKFSVRATVDNIKLARQWKSNKNANAVTVTATTVDGSITRTFTNCAIVNDYEVALQADGVLELEFKGNKPTI